jgi:hypothetical protein
MQFILNTCTLIAESYKQNKKDFSLFFLFFFLNRYDIICIYLKWKMNRPLVMSTSLVTVIATTLYWKPISTYSVVEKSHLCANAVERRMKMSLISCYYVLRFASKEKSHFVIMCGQAWQFPHWPCSLISSCSNHVLCVCSS